MSAPKAADRERHGLPRLVRDMEKKTVRTLREITTGRAVYPAGKLATIYNASSWERLTLRGEPCVGCGVELFISRVSWRDVAVVGQ